MVISCAERTFLADTEKPAEYRRFRPVKKALEVSLDKNELVEILNREQPSLDLRDKLVLRYAESYGDIPQAEAELLWRAEVSCWLRRRIDEWLKSGLNSDGVNHH
jgi:hypothetical protein